MAHAEVPRLMLEVGSLLGADRVRRPLACEIPAAEMVVEPASVEELAELIRKCEADAITVVPIGGCRTAGLMRRHPAQLAISLRRVSEVVAYEPDDLTVVVGAGCSIADLNRRLSNGRQRLPVDPRHCETATVGATIAAAHSGPLRLSRGRVRDLLIGIQFVTHQGRIARAGGRVVKNVTGYDLMKVMTGSFGTLGIITEAAFKIQPVPQRYAMAKLSCNSVERAFALALELNALPLEHLEVISPELAHHFGCDANRALLLAGLAGTAAELDYLSNKLGASAAGFSIDYDEKASAQYRILRDLMPKESICLLIATGIVQLPAHLKADLQFIAHAGCGVAKVSPSVASDTNGIRQWLSDLRSALHREKGTARVISLESDLRGRLEIFDRPNDGSMRLMARLKREFDPHGIFNPGSFVGGL